MHDLIEIPKQEYLPPLAYFEVSAQTRPFKEGGVVVLRFDVGLTLQEVVDNLQIKKEYQNHISLFIGSNYIDRSVWDKVKPKPGAHVYLKLNMQGGDGSGILGTLLVAVVTAVAYIYLGPIGGAIVGTLFAYGYNKVFGPDAPSDAFSVRSIERSEKESPTYSISSARNRLAQYEPVPVVLGTHKMVPPYGAAPYTEIVGDDQYLRFVVLWGYGPVSVSDVKIGNTPIEDFVEVETEDDFDGTLDTLTLYPQDVSQENLNITLSDSYQSRQTAIDVDEFGVTITWPQGLVRYDGLNRKNTSVTVTAQYKLSTSGTWIDWFETTYTDNTAEVKREATRKTGIARGTYDIRLKVTGVNGGTAYRETTNWTALRSFTNEDPINLEGVAKSAYRIKATDQLNGIVDQLNGVVSLKIPTWSGSEWTGETATSNPAAIFRYILTGEPNARALLTTQVDDDSLSDWYDFCETNGFTYNSVIDYRTSVRQLMQDVAAAGRATPSLVDDKWGVIIDREKTTVIQHFTPRNSSNFNSQIQFIEMPHALRCRFLNENKGYREDERVVYDDGYDSTNATKFELLELAGQTNPDNVYKLARYYLAGLRLRPEVFNFEVDFEHLIATRGDLIRFSHDVPKVGLAVGRIKSVSGNDLTLDEPVTMESGKSYSVRIREAGGDTNLQSVTLDVGTQSTITIDDATGIAAGDLFMFGENDEDSLELIISSIEPQDDLKANISAVPYSPDIFNADAVIPPYTTVLSDPVSSSFIGPPKPIVNNIVSDEDALTRNTQGSLQPSIILYVKAGAANSLDGTVTTTDFFQARYRRTGTQEAYQYTPLISTDSRTIVLQPVDQGQSYDIGVRSIGPNGTTSGFVTIINHTVLGASAKPTPLTTFTLNSLSEFTYLEWTYTDIPIDVIGYEIRYHPDQDIQSWQSMTIISDEIPREARSFAVPSRKGSYGIKAIDILGNRSTSALFINASLEDPESLNVIDTLTENPDFTGTKDDVDIVNGSLQLASQSVMSDWDTLSNVSSMTYGTGQGIASIGYYYFGETDLSEVYTSRISASLDISSVDFLNVMSTWETLSSVDTLAGSSSGDEYSVELQIAYSLDDVASGQNYTDWRRFVVGDYTARWVKFRAVLMSNQPEIGPSIDELTVNIDMPDRINQGEDIASGAGTKSISFSPAFKVLKSVNITGQNLQQGDYWNVTNKTRTGFDVTFKNSSGTDVDRTFDYQAIGYGRERNT